MSRQLSVGIQADEDTGETTEEQKNNSMTKEYGVLKPMGKRRQLLCEDT